MPTSQEKRLRAERAAAARREQERRERRRRVLSVAAVVVAVVLVVVGGFLLTSRGDSSDDTAARVPGPGSPYGLTIGPADAPHQVVVYEDFLCPFCGEFEARTHEQLASLAADGAVRVEYRPIVFLSAAGPYSARSTLIWYLVHQEYGDEVAEELHDLLFAHQPSEDGPFPSRDDLYALAAQAGADAAQVKAAVEAGEGATDVADLTNTAKELGIKATPTVILDGEPFTDGRTVDDLASNLLQAVQ